MRLLARAFVFAALAATIASPAAAQQSVADFYKGKTIALLLGTGPGGSYDLYARIFAEHLGKHIPGNPNIIVEHMPGAGGVTAGNHLFGPGPQDGTKILLSHAIIMSEVLDPKAGVRFQSAKFNWIGTYDAIAHTHGALARGAGEDHRRSQEVGIVIGSFAKAHFTYQMAGDDEGRARARTSSSSPAIRPAITTTSRWSAARSTAGRRHGRT